jgi:hypothetical protein
MTDGGANWINPTAGIMCQALHKTEDLPIFQAAQGFD